MRAQRECAQQNRNASSAPSRKARVAVQRAPPRAALAPAHVAVSSLGTVGGRVRDPASALVAFLHAALGVLHALSW